ncbi:MAG: hypothetical protein KC635_28665, partial [Myxococcales bacterium]|nr:hypothetical protein [Myxococcales bacterium]
MRRHRLLHLSLAVALAALAPLAACSGDSGAGGDDLADTAERVDSGAADIDATSGDTEGAADADADPDA